MVDGDSVFSRGFWFSSGSIAMTYSLQNIFFLRCGSSEAGATMEAACKDLANKLLPQHKNTILDFDSSRLLDF